MTTGVSAGLPGGLPGGTEVARRGNTGLPGGTGVARRGNTGLPGGTEGLRRGNTALVLRTLRQQGPATRTELARRTGLAKATVGVIVSALAEAGAVQESPDPATGSGRGRPGRPVVLTGESLLGVGLELNVDYVAAVVVDLSGTIRVRETRSATPRTALDRLAALAAEVGAGLAPARLVGAMAAVPGLVRGDDRTLAWAPNLEVASGELTGRCEEALGSRCHVGIGNDANCAAYAESHHGAAADVAHALYITGTVGIGGGIITDGRLLRGAEGFAGEVGHMPLGDADKVCGCGRRGCWEATIGLHAMLAAVGMPELETPIASAEAVAAAAADDPAVRRALATLGGQVGLGLASLSTILDPEVVVLGGYFAPLAEYVLPEARAALDARLPSPAQRRPEVRASTLGILAAALGAAERSLEEVFSGAVLPTGA